MSYWRGKRAVITGGSAGLGRALAGVLVQHGARVAIVARRAEPLEKAAGELRHVGGNVLSVTADVTNPTDVDRLAATVQSAWGGLDLLCNCAGRSMRGTVLTTPIEDFRQLWETNFLSALQCSKAFAPTLAHSHGHIVLVGSLASKVAAAYLGAYPTSKFPLAALAQQMRLELGEAGPHVLLVCPGPIARDDEVSANSPRSLLPTNRRSSRSRSKAGRRRQSPRDRSALALRANPRCLPAASSRANNSAQSATTLCHLTTLAPHRRLDSAPNDVGIVHNMNVKPSRRQERQACECSCRLGAVFTHRQNVCLDRIYLALLASWRLHSYTTPRNKKEPGWHCVRQPGSRIREQLFAAARRHPSPT